MPSSILLENITQFILHVVILDDSPLSQVNNGMVNSVVHLIDSKDHLRRNINDIKYGAIKDYRESNLKFRHEIQFILHVKTASLWETPRAYLWKHLGTSTWTLNDGTRISFVKIHRK